jgi:hypothetical protein
MGLVAILFSKLIKKKPHSDKNSKYLIDSEKKN